MRLLLCSLALALTALIGAYSPASAAATQAVATKPQLGETSAVEQARHRKRWRHRHLFRFGYGYPFYGFSIYSGPRWRYRRHHWHNPYGYYGYSPRWHGYSRYW